MSILMEEFINGEKKKADLLHRLVNPSSSAEMASSGFQDGDYLDTDQSEISEFYHFKSTLLPDEIQAEINRKQNSCNFGIIPLISRAWVSVDSNLFLWNYETNKDLVFLDSLTATIKKVEVVNVKPNFFEDSVKFLLVIVTTEEIVLLAVSFVNECNSLLDITKSSDKPSSVLTMKEVHKSSLDGLVVNQLHCTQNGRIFFASEDNLHELTYYLSIWNSRVYKHVSFTKGFFSGLMPAFASKDTICQIECDNSRHILYTLSAQSNILVYDLGEQGSGLSHVTSYSIDSLQQKIEKCFGIDRELFKEIISITAIPSTQSMYVNLSATLSSGARVYFTCSNDVFFEKGNERMSQSVIRPVKLEPIHFRCSPMPSAVFLNSNFTSYYTKVIDDVTVIVLASPDSNIPSTFAMSASNFPHSSRLKETRENLLIEHLIWSIESESTQQFEREFVNGLELVPSTQLSAYARQHTDRQMMFHVVTTQGIATFIHKKPVELLYNLLETFGPDSEQFETFLGLHGSFEICVMALILLSSDTHHIKNIKETLLHLFNVYGDNPTDRSRAVFTYFARVVYPIWHKRICTVKDGLYVSGLSLEEVREVLSYVSGLRQVVEVYDLFTGSHPVENDLLYADELFRKDKISVKAFHNLMILCQEYLALWQIILETSVHNTILNLKPDLRAQFQNLTFSQLVGMPESVGLELISALTHYYLNDESGSAAISERLSNECPRLFTNEDANVFKATELIFLAKKAKNIEERQEFIDRALSMLKRHAKRINLREVVELLKQVNCFRGIVELVIACANAVDPQGLALLAYRRQTPEAESLETLQMIKKREEVYSVLVDTLSYLHRLSVTDGKNEKLSVQLNDATLSSAGARIGLDCMIDFVAESTDDLCNVALFRFLISNHLEDLLIREVNPYFESFVAREIKATSDTRFMDLMWRYYKGIGASAKAALFLYELATTPSQSISADKKIEYLSQALVCANSSPETLQNVELRQKIRDWLDVATIQQQIREALRSASTNAFEAAELSESLNVLDANLLTLNELFQIASTFGLSEMKTKIYDCAGINEVERV